jgi:hypothetical protein
VLAATLHDPTGGLAPMIRHHAPALSALYRDVVVTTSLPTAEGLRSMLRAAGAYGGTPRTNARGPLYRLALRRALASDAALVHYLDFDRALHWVAHRADELAAVLRSARRHDALLVGRTLAAHRTHQRPLFVTETEANALLAHRLRLAGRVDFLVPSFVLDRGAATRLLARSHARDTAIYGEWAGLLAGIASSLAYIECAGLDWETPDRHPRAVARLGLAAWRRRMATPKEWKLRRALRTEFLRGFERALTRWPADAPRIRRIRAYM